MTSVEQISSVCRWRACPQNYPPPMPERVTQSLDQSTEPECPSSDKLEQISV